MTPTNNTAPKALAGVVAIVAVIAGVYAMVEPMGQRIDFTTVQITRLENSLQRSVIADTNHQRLTDTNLAELREKFKEVETQFQGLREVLAIELKHIDKSLAELQTAHRRQ